MRKARRFNCQAESVAGARHFARDVLSDQPREIVEAAELMVSELATNSVRHANSDFELAIHLSRDEIRVELSDHGQGQPVLRSPTPREQSGRGLRIVQALSEDWGVTPSPNGKLVWFTLPLRPHTGEHKSRATASREKAPEQSHGLGAPSNAIHRLTKCVYRAVGVGTRMPAQGSVEADRGLANRGPCRSLAEESSGRRCAGHLRRLRRARSPRRAVAACSLGRAMRLRRPR